MDRQASPDIYAVAAEVVGLLGTGRQAEPFSRRYEGFGLHEAYQVTAEVHRLREERGERPVGRKIGFTNRTIWTEYNVHAPIWGYVYDRTLHDLQGAGRMFSLAGLAEPRIEPEIVFGVGQAPTPGMDERALLGCIEWVAHGFEIVQSIFPRWEFVAPDTVAGNGLHGALLVGPRHAVVPERLDDWHRRLSSFDIDLFRNGVHIDRGRAANVLDDGPLSALRHVVGLLAEDPGNPPLSAGEIVTTGTLTRAFPVSPGETWTTTLHGIDLEGARVNFGE